LGGGALLGGAYIHNKNKNKDNKKKN
jgi:hypothetical protein